MTTIVAKRVHPRSTEAQAYRRWYNLKAWKVARQAQLAQRPLCERCEKAGRITAATVVNHKTPHKGGWSLFIDSEMCASNAIIVADAMNNRAFDKKRSRGRIDGMVSIAQSVGAAHNEFGGDAGMPVSPRARGALT